MGGRDALAGRPTQKQSNRARSIVTECEVGGSLTCARDLSFSHSLAPTIAPSIASSIFLPPLLCLALDGHQDVLQACNTIRSTGKRLYFPIWNAETSPRGCAFIDGCTLSWTLDPGPRWTPGRRRAPLSSLPLIVTLWVPSRAIQYGSLGVICLDNGSGGGVPCLHQARRLVFA